MISVPDVETLMAGGLGDWLATKAEEREKIRRQTRRDIILWLVGTVLAAIIPRSLDMNIEIISYICIGILLIIFIKALYTHTAMIYNLKSEMNGALAKHLGIEYLLTPSSGSELDIACQFGLLPEHEESMFQDGWYGDIGGTDFLIYEVTLFKRSKRGLRRRKVLPFNGVLLRFKFARVFQSTTLVLRDSVKFRLFEKAKNFGGIKFERLKMVDPKFEDTFDVYSNDQVEGRYLVHPSYCERLLEMEKDFAGSDLVALFHGGDLIVIIKAQNMFESATLDPKEDQVRLARTIKQFASMAKLIQLLNERPRG